MGSFSITPNATDADEFPLTGPAFAEHGTEPPLPSIPVRLRLVPTRESRPATLLLVSAGERDELESLLRTSGERLASQLQIATIGNGSQAAYLVRPSPRRKKLPGAAWPGIPFCSHPEHANLYLPAGYTLRPNLRQSRLRAVLGTGGERMIWLVNRHDGLLAASIAFNAFHAPKLALSVARRVKLAIPLSARDPFAPLPFATANPAIPVSIGESNVAAPRKSKASSPPSEGWLGRLVRSLRKKRPTEVATPAEPPTHVEGLLATPDSFSTGSFVSTRRAELERRVLNDLSTAGDDARAKLWADLAETYALGRRPAEAALAWLNAIWEAPSPPATWFESLVREETSSARRPAGDQQWELWLAAPASLPMVRLAAAHLIFAASGTTSKWDFRPHLPALLRSLDEVESDLPVRLVWLARLAASAFVASDALSLARSRDAIFARLAGSGPALDRDAPAFLRFAGHGHGHREARDWVLRMRDPARRWVRRIAGGGRLQRFGLDGEADATAAYVDFLFAWAAGRHGERAAATEWEAAATAALRKIGGPVHARLVEAFKQRIREARDGHATGPSPLAEPGELDEFERFVVRKFQSISTVLEPYARPDPHPRNTHSESLFPGTLRTAENWTDALPRRLRDPSIDVRERAALIETALAVAARFELPSAIAVVVESLTGGEAPPLPAFGTLFDRIGIPFFQALRRFSFDATELVKRLDPTCGPSGDVRSAVSAAGWFLAGRDERGLERLDACRERLYADAIDRSERTTLAIATAQALGLAPPRVALGRLEEFFTRLERIDVTGSSNRYVTLKSFQIVEAAVRSAVGSDALPTSAVKAWLAADEQVILRRIARDARAAIG